MKELSIYVHIPFCSKKCYYCNFCSFKANSKEQEQYFNALQNEIEFRAKQFPNQTVKTIYFGGGTPSVVETEQIKKILDKIKQKFLVLDKSEITIELNPNSTSEEKLLKYYSLGINRLSFGVQSFNKRALTFVGRLSEEEAGTYKTNVLSLLKAAKEIGFKNISVDFILGLPLQTKNQLVSTLKKLSKFVTHFSCYMLETEGTKLEDVLKFKPDEEEVINQYEAAVKALKKLGFKRYEISNFAKPSFESNHNQTYWRRQNYLGFGLAAHSFVENQRFANTEDFRLYLKVFGKVPNKKTLIESGAVKAENLTKKQCAEEALMLSLRTSEGLNLKEFKENFFDIEKVHAKKIATYLKAGLISLEGNFLRLTGKGILVANEIIVNFADDFLELVSG